MPTPFHLAFPVDDLAATRHFYGDILGCSEGRSSESWIDFNFFGHQIVAHLVDGPAIGSGANAVDGHDVPVPHFGVVLPRAEWDRIAERLESAGVCFEIAPGTRFKGEPGEQSTLFLRDPAGNALEFKSFADPGQLFAC